MANTPETRTEKGISLARGPALILGTILQVAGLYLLYKQHTFPKLANFPSGKAPVEGKVFLGIFGANGWTGLLTAAGGGLLLFGAAHHLLAKTMSLIVGIALGVAAIIALVNGNVLGLAAANHWTEIGWGAVAAILLFNAMIPRRRKVVVVDEGSEDSEPARATASPTRVRSGAEVPPRVPEPTTRVSEPTTRVSEPTTRVSEPMIRTTEPTTRVAEPMTRTTEPTTPADEPITTVDEPATPLKSVGARKAE